ncbi:MAG TPA: cytochrome d ubiquinol oxidase subunit II, partial [Thermomicrobiales bacterium]|nr:cytochrome d ubiquinol oxidase subunit II [Thermomicrobiales bacterium]
WHAVVGGFAVVGFALVHAGAFLALKTDGAVRQRARRFVVTFASVLLVPIVIWVFAVLATDGNRYTWPLIAVAAIAASVAWLRMRAGHEGQAFAGMAIFLIAGAAAIFGSVYPVVLPSTLNPAWNLTIDSASSSPYTLKLMSIIAAFGVPLVLVYQGWTYWVFRQRISEHHIPDAHTVPVAVAPPSPTPTIRTHTQAGQPL